MKWREKFSRRTRVILTIILIIIFAALIIYAVGLASQTVARLIFQKAITIALDPLSAFRYAFLFDYSKYVWLAVGVAAVVLLGYSVTMSDKRGKMDATRRAENGNFDYSNKEGEELYFIFGKESTGIPKDILKNDLDRCMRIPMTSNVRALNVSNAVAIVIYEALRQQDYNDLLREEPHKGADYLERD